MLVTRMMSTPAGDPLGGLAKPIGGRYWGNVDLRAAGADNLCAPFACYARPRRTERQLVTRGPHVPQFSGDAQRMAFMATGADFLRI